MGGGVVAGAGLSGLAFVAACQLALDFSPIEDAGSMVADAAPDDGEVDAADLCGELEPNDQLEAAARIEVGTFRAAICGAGESDYYVFTLDGNQDLSVEITFAAGANDLQLELIDVATAMVLVESVDGDGDERIVRAAAQGNRLVGGEYAVRVFGRSADVANDYDLNLARGPLPEAAVQRMSSSPPGPVGASR